MGKFQVITLTDTAAERVRAIMANSDKDVQGLKIGVQKGGCAGMEYTLDYVSESDPADDVVETKGVRIYVAPFAVLFLLGTEMDYEETKLRSGFIFNNPNQTSACGCGESVEITPANPEALTR
ncbi:Fe-S cluster assembly scaffold SufA [Breoghania sp.]|uniref:Fe-S cluster assembly scaffold SufA n=1 Tax=Breoghania sp. TaxID=2065378 RepID=UPI002614012C|nr:Fe-S cluster assembly scaffold SufA [Breoghania sp.]MDJ0932903.1 Fe-S cluster assembly scaffold SufA [Breoghania sp.]